MTTKKAIKRDAVIALYRMFDKHEKSEMKLVGLYRKLYKMKSMKKNGKYTKEAKELTHNITSESSRHDVLEHKIMMDMARFSKPQLEIIRDPELTLSEVLMDLGLDDVDDGDCDCGICS